MADAREPTLLAVSHDHHAACGLCGDVASEAEVVAVVDGGAVHARADGCEIEIATDLVGPVRPGDRLLVHVGFAVARLEEP